MSTFWAQICSCSVFLFSSCFLYSFCFFTFFIYVFLEFVGGMLLGRTLSILLTMTIGTSMAARQGPTAMAAHQICLQVWLAVSLLADALAVSAQVCFFSFRNHSPFSFVSLRPTGLLCYIQSLQTSSIYF